ncbi:Trp biosynthesis-associated membrane protein [Geodermatophilus marinus]|uniref:Trp biosynthesis-associated membrane protein n=1 Tax=Geodermatophilus sp. LHW52908 TaxID=2303986 RepID=UPI000E3E16CD|nr:Trp biosynthesis-associated membrane protein [Geodermatophilus sp. LHW52908]RFU22625.1 Trp biosynthesis protein [Geodermatophilus sp. LHW52908]
MSSQGREPGGPPAAGGAPATGAAARGHRRETTAAVVGSALAGGLALSAGGQAWLTLTVARPAPLPPTTDVLTGGETAPLVPAAGLLLLAAAVAVVAARGAGRRVVGLLTALAGGVLGWSGLRPLVGDPAAGVGASADVHAGWPLLAVAAGVVAVAAGLLTVLRGPSWPGLGRRHERTGQPSAARPRTDGDRALDAWRALDRGEDPTDDPTDAPTDDPTGDRADGPTDDPTGDRPGPPTATVRATHRAGAGHPPVPPRGPARGRRT